MPSSPPSPLGPLVRSLSLRAPLGDQDRRAILALPHALRTLEPASYLVREGDPPRHCGVLISGYAYRQKLTGDGRGRSSRSTSRARRSISRTSCSTRPITASRC